MAHMLEINKTTGEASMAYAGERPWHSLGKKVPHDLTPEQMCEAAGCDWEVEKREAFIHLNGKRIVSGAGFLVRKPNGKQITEESILTVLPNMKTWYEHQNAEAFQFFHDAVMAGDMEMETAGSLHNGEIVWALAKIKESFNVVGRKDTVQSYMLFINPHRFGQSIHVRFTPTRVVCNNTLTLALSEKAMTKVTSTHRNPFDAEAVKEKLGMASFKLNEYKERAQFLASKKYTNQEAIDYMKLVFPANPSKAAEDSTRAKKDMHKGASTALKLIDIQPGADIAPGTWWNLYNAATFYTNHLMGKSEDARCESLWMGDAQKINLRALNVAVAGADGKDMVAEAAKKLVTA